MTLLRGSGPRPRGSTATRRAVHGGAPGGISITAQARQADPLDRTNGSRVASTSNRRRSPRQCVSRGGNARSRTRSRLRTRSRRVGRYDEAISSLQALNRVRPDRSIEVRLVELRSEAFLRGATPPTRPVWPEAVADLFPGSVIPEINGREVTVDHVRSAIWNHGSLIVRGLVDPQRVAELVGDIDAALAGYDAESAGTASDETSRWYRPIARDRMSDLEQKRFRGAVITRGSVLTVDSPRSLFDLIETFDETRLTSILHDYFGERPLLLARKCTLRRISPNGQNGGWHQDGAFMGAGIRSINVWIALTHCGDTAPGLDIVGRRLNEIVQTGKGAFAAWATDPEAAERVASGSVVRPIFEPGDAMLFDHMNLHRTANDADMRHERHAIETWLFAPLTYDSMIGDTDADYAPRDQIPDRVLRARRRTSQHEFGDERTPCKVLFKS